MFSGIVENKAKIISFDKGRFKIENIFGKKLKQGQSVAHDGACMTIENSDEKTYTFFAMEETLKKTNFGTKSAGDNFNLERCLRVGDRLDGHFVTGHIDTVGELIKIEEIEDSSIVMGIKFAQEYKKLLVYKGSVTVNGVSLTVIKNDDNYFEISLIPHTLDITNLGDIKIGDFVNLEFDILGKYILNK